MLLLQLSNLLRDLGDTSGCVQILTIVEDCRMGPHRRILHALGGLLLLQLPLGELEHEADLVQPLLVCGGGLFDRRSGLPNLRLQGLLRHHRRLTDGPSSDQFFLLSVGWRV